MQTFLKPCALVALNLINTPARFLNSTWKLKENKQDFDITWSILKRAVSYIWLPDCSKIQYTQFIFNTHILYSIHTFYIQYTLRIFNKPVLYSIFTEIYSRSSQKHSITLFNNYIQ